MDIFHLDKETEEQMATPYVHNVDTAREKGCSHNTQERHTAAACFCPKIFLSTDLVLIVLYFMGNREPRTHTLHLQFHGGRVLSLNTLSALETICLAKGLSFMPSG